MKGGKGCWVERKWEKQGKGGKGYGYKGKGKGGKGNYYNYRSSGKGVGKGLNNMSDDWYNAWGAEEVYDYTGGWWGQDGDQLERGGCDGQLGNGATDERKEPESKRRNTIRERFRRR